MSSRRFRVCYAGRRVRRDHVCGCLREEAGTRDPSAGSTASGCPAAGATTAAAAATATATAATAATAAGTD